MPSSKRVEPLYELENDLRLTAADIEALWSVRELDHLPPIQYIEWCTLLSGNHPASRDDLATDEHLPFELFE
ncbi:MAG: hypothetical protein QOC81_2110 [Thermoanaerobaculia bacterium]|jgi:hypothetical protein|nr:hypothetical protein [Thermoanaerobaculia bacterium]